jgi:intein-encoded DNA endonuclease-like protein
MKTQKDLTYSFSHTKLRLKERYNLDLNIKEYLKLCQISRNLETPISIEEQKDNTQKIFEIIFF